MTLIEGIDLDGLTPAVAGAMLKSFLLEAFQSRRAIAPSVLEAMERSGGILREARFITYGLERGPVREQAKALLQRLETILEHDPKLTTIGRPIISQEGAPFSLQWHLPDRRLAFVIESNEDESGWHFVSKRSAGGVMAYGELSGDLASPLQLLLASVH